MGPDSAAKFDLNDIDASSLTTRERQEWTGLVSELLAPCPDQAMTLARCVGTKAPCTTCLPAARMLVNLIEKGRTTDQAREAYRIRYSAEAAHAITLDGSPARGAAHPVVTIVEWADFECPFCALSAHALHLLVDKYPDRVRVVFKHYPLSIHPNADRAARAAVAADLQGKFWQMHDRLFAAPQAGLDQESVGRLARQIGLDETAFARDCEGAQARAVLLRDRQQADQLELRGTPFIYINGRHFDLNLFDLGQDLEDWIREEITLAADAHPGSSPARSASPAPSLTHSPPVASAPAQTDAPAGPATASVGSAESGTLPSSPPPQPASRYAHKPAVMPSPSANATGENPEGKKGAAK